VRYAGRRVWCATHRQAAVVSVIERADARPPLRFVRWCSLRGIGACDEHCLAAGRRRSHDGR
jgi:hypothetical protein